MNITSFTSQNIAQYYNYNRHLKPKHFLRPIKRSKLLTVVVSFVIICIALITAILMLYFKCKQVITANISQALINHHQQDVTQDMQSRLSQLQRNINHISSKIEHKQTTLTDIKQTYAHSLTIQDHEVSARLNGLQQAIYDAQNTKHNLADRNQLLVLNITNHYDVKYNGYIKQRAELLKQIDTLEQQVKHKANSNNNIPLGKYDSVIISTDDQFQLLRKWIEIGDIRLDLIYRGTDKENSLKEFREKCSGEEVRNTLILIQIKDGPIIGGFTYNNFSGLGYKSDYKAFIFNLSNNNQYKINYPKEAMYVDQKYWFQLGFGDIFIGTFDYCLSNFPSSYGVFSDKLELTNRIKFFKIETLEVFVVYSSN